MIGQEKKTSSRLRGVQIFRRHETTLHALRCSPVCLKGLSLVTELGLHSFERKSFSKRSSCTSFEK